MRPSTPYGTAAATVVAVGIARVFLGPLDASFYLGNLLFWAKMAAFGAVGLASIAPTRRFQRWRVAAADERWAPPAAEVEASRRTLRLELALFALIPVCAALMARGIGR